MEGLFLAGDIMVALGALAAWLFVLMYRRLDWRANAIGKFLMRFILLVALILTAHVTATFFDLAPEVRVIIRFAIYLSIFVELTLLNSLLVHYEKKARLVHKEHIPLKKETHDG